MSSATAATTTARGQTTTTTRKVRPPKGWLHFVAGGVGGMCGAIVTSPLDVVKTRLQSDLYSPSSSSSSSSSSSLGRPAPPRSAPPQGVVAAAKRLGYHFVETGHLLRDISVREGPRALFKGLGPTLVGAVPARSINFFTYGNGKIILTERLTKDGVETPLIHLSAAALAGVATATATNPIWVIKTRLQLESQQFEREHNERRRSSVRREGARAASSAGEAWRARTTGAAAAATASASASSSAASPSRADAARTLATRATATAAPVTANGGNFFVASPRPRRPTTNSLRMAARVVREEGLRGLYRGLSASYLGVAEGTIQWVLYERLKRWGGGGVAAAAAESTAASATSGGGVAREGKLRKWLNTVGAAGTAKCVASLITYPHEVVRTRMRQQPPPGQPPRYVGLWQTFSLVWREEGVASLYGGLSAHLLRVVPNAAIMFSVYELALRIGSRNEADVVGSRAGAEGETRTAD